MLTKEEKSLKVVFIGEAATEAAPADGANPMDSLARADISKDVEKLLKKLTDKDIKVKKEGLDALENLLVK